MPSGDLRWSVYIDIEGFGALYEREDAVLLALCDLMEGIFFVGSKCYPESPARLFAHQTGDGFIIVSEFGAASLEVPVALSVALLRHVVRRGRFAKATIAEGEFSGINGCYHQSVRDAEVDGRVFMGGGLMTLFPIMGTALINAVALAKRSPSGALLTLAASEVGRLPSACTWQDAGHGVASIDWVHSQIPLTSTLQREAGLFAPDAAMIASAFASYFANSGVKDSWKSNTMSYLGLAAHDL